MKYLLLFTTLIFAGELEVDGDLKVTGTGDANGNPITNVGAPLLSTDAVNAGIVKRSERFTPEVQEKIARFLLERSGLESMLSGKMSPKDYREKLSKVWASIPGKIKKVGGQPTPANVKRIEDAFSNAINELKVGSNSTAN